MKSHNYVSGLCFTVMVVSASLVQAADLRVQILGSGGPGHNPQRAEASVLIRTGDADLLVDMGNGTAAALDKAGVRVNSLAALMMTHHHIDHDQEFAPILVKTLLGPQGPAVIGPSGTKSLTDFVTGFYKEDITYRRSNGGQTGAFPLPSVREVHGGESFDLLGMAIKTAAVQHTIETVAYRFDLNGKSVVVSGDLYYSESLAVLAKNADLLIIDSGGVAAVGRAAGSGQGARNGGPANRQVANGGGASRERSHSTAEELVKMVADAQVKTVVLTHFGKRSVDEEAVRQLFAASTDSSVIFAVDMLELTP